MSEEDFNALKTKAEKYYASVSFVRCPALNNEKVHLSAEGFNHLKYSNKRARSQQDQAAKFKLLEKATILIGRTSTIQEYFEQHELVVYKRHKKVVKEYKVVGYWAFIAIISGTRLKVVVKRIENSKYLFWSVIPTWQTKEYLGHKITSKSSGDIANQ